MKFRDVVSKTLQMLEIGQINEENELAPFRRHRTALRLRPFEELIFKTLDHSVDRLVASGRYTFDQELSKKEKDRLLSLFIQQVKRTKLQEDMAESSAKELQEEAMEKLNEVLPHI